MTILEVCFHHFLRRDCQNLFLFHIVRAKRAGLRIALSQMLDSVARRDLMRE
jgi:hypothetical protein